MRLSFRAKLNAIVATAACALIALMVAGAITSSRMEDRLAEIQQRYLPKLELGPKLEGGFDRLRRALQDAVAARDLDAMNATAALEEKFLADLDASAPALTVGQIAAVRSVMADYYSAAVDVSRRLIGGETGERLVDAMAAMQAKQARAADLVKTVTTFDRGELGAAFTSTRRMQENMSRIRLMASIGCLLCVLLLSIGLGRSVVKALSDLATGLRRFGAGDFSRPVTVTSHDELGDLAEQANQMAASLKRFGDERDQNDWIKAALAGLGQELRGELEPEEAANRAVRFLARYLDAPVAALYYVDDENQLRLLGQYAGDVGAIEATPRFRFGEGLVGQAALSDEPTIVEDPPAGHLRLRSGLGDSAPRALVLMPLTQSGRTRGILELALLRPWSERAREVLKLVRETLAIAIEVSRARASTRALLAETQRQAERLARQEEALRSSNEELESQQEELRQTNDDLKEQAEELEAQRRALELSNGELETARRGLEQKAAELTTVSDYKSQFLANMSHELRTPLNSMLLLSNMLADNEGRNLTAKQIEYARTIHTAGRDLLVLINQVLDLSKIEAGKHELRVTDVALRDLITHIERVFTPLARDKQLGFAVEVAPDVPSTMNTDKQRLEQILNNLLGNAIKFTERGDVTLRVSTAAAANPSRGDGVVFAVSDTGLGIARADQARIFAPFEQVDAAIDRRYGGTGLGLSISRELAQLLGGELSLESTPGKGSTFTLHLPLRAPVPMPAGPGAQAPGVSAAAPAASASRASADRKLSLLVIEDDRRFAEALADVVHGQGIDCLLAFDGRSGVRMARDKQPAGIILDIKLPDVDGWQVMAELREDDATARIPVHFISALSAAERGLALGAVGYLTKPASKEDIFSAVEALLPRKAHRAPHVLVVEDDLLTGDSLAKQLASEKLEVRRAMNAHEALDALARERFGCMVLDLGLPDMDGLELLGIIRERHGADMPAVVVYTSRGLSRAEAKALEAYTEAVVLKEGASVERLLDEVRLFTRRLKDGLGAGHAATPARAHAAFDFGGRRVLIADDDMRTVYALSAMLRSKGLDVLVADTGAAALAVLNDHPDVDAVLMDIMMPEMDGFEAIRRLRKDPRFAKLLVVTLTAKAMKGDREKCLEAGATEYLPKPVDADRLLALLATHLGAEAK
jgi:CheY-like chemotaxis protein/signal transduction histidine kinase